MMRASRGTVAQLVEQGPFKALVLGSSPSRPTNKSMSYASLAVSCTETVRKSEGEPTGGRWNSGTCQPSVTGDK
jgi:hypothetical protein